MSTLCTIVPLIPLDNFSVSSSGLEISAVQISYVDQNHGTF